MKIFNRKTAFAPLSEEEKKEQAERKKRFVEDISKVREAAIACMQSKEFTTYLERLMNAREAYMDAFIQVDLTAPNGLALAIQLQTEIKAHAFLLTEAVKDASAGQTPVKTA